MSNNYFFLKNFMKYYIYIKNLLMGIGECGFVIWGLVIGVVAQSPFPNPQSPIPNNIKFFLNNKF